VRKIEGKRRKERVEEGIKGRDQVKKDSEREERKRG
jgi:hypothetical protein